MYSDVGPKEKERKLCFADFCEFMNSTHGPTKDTHAYKFVERHQSKRIHNVVANRLFLMLWMEFFSLLENSGKCLGTTFASLK